MNMNAMNTIYVTDGDRDSIVTEVAMTVYDYTAPKGQHAEVFGDISSGYMRKVDVDIASLDGLLSGGGIIGYFSEAALAKPHGDANVPLLVEMIAAGPRQDVVLPPFLRNTPESIVGRVAAHPLTLEEQHALFRRVLGKDWKKQVEHFVAKRKKREA